MNEFSKRIGKWDRENKELKVTHTRELSPQLKNADISLYGGQLFIEGTKSKNPKLNTELTITGETEESAREALGYKRGELLISGTAARLVVDGRSEIDTDEREIEDTDAEVEIPESPNQIRRKVSLFVPEGKKIAYKLETNVADTTLTNVKGKTTIDSTFGNVGMTNYEGTMTANTIGGHVTGELVEGDLDVQTIDGEVIFENLTGKAKIHTTTQDISLIEAALKGVDNRAVSFGGNVEVTVKNNSLGVTIQGEVGKVSLPEEPEFVEDASSVNVSEYGIHKIVWGHIGEEPQPFHRLFIQSETGEVSIKKSDGGKRA